MFVMHDHNFKLVVLISGNGSNLQSLIDSIENQTLAASISAVISNKQNAPGLERAKSAGIPTMVVDPDTYSESTDYDLALADIVSNYKPDLIVLAGYMRILSKPFVTRFEQKIVNIHPSLLPRHKGLNTHQRALESADKFHGATVHYVTAELDDGPIIIQQQVPVQDNDTAETLGKRVLIQEHKIYPKAIHWAATGVIDFNHPQPHL